MNPSQPDKCSEIMFCGFFAFPNFRICSIFQFQNLNFTDLERTNKNDSSEQSCKDLQSGISTIDDNSCEWGILVENHIKKMKAK